MRTEEEAFLDDKHTYKMACEKMKIAQTEGTYRAAAEMFDSIAQYKNAFELARVCREKAEECRKERIYRSAQLNVSRFNIEMNIEAAKLFRQIPGWKDADAQAEKCETKVKELKLKEEEDRQAKEREQEAKLRKRERQSKLKKYILIFVPVIIVISITLTYFVIPEIKYNAAVSLMEEGKYEEAISAFDIIEGYKDSYEQILNCKYYIASNLMSEGRYEEAIEKFEKIWRHKDSADQIEICETAIKDDKYDAAVALMNEGRYEEAIWKFKEIRQHKDSADQIEICETAIKDDKYDAAVALMNAEKYEEAYRAFSLLDNHKDSEAKADSIYDKAVEESLAKATVGSYVIFGYYEQDNNMANGREVIEWLVLDKKEDCLLVLSRYGIDCQPYHKYYTDITWEKCTLRGWLNDVFMKKAFSSTEQARVLTVTVPAEKNPEFSTPPGKSTQDQMFLLSYGEVEKYFLSNSATTCEPTAYTRTHGASVEGGYSPWWLRTPGFLDNCATFVDYRKGPDTMGVSVDFSMCAIRPAMWISLK